MHWTQDAAHAPQHNTVKHMSDTVCRPVINANTMAFVHHHTIGVPKGHLAPNNKLSIER